MAYCMLKLKKVVKVMENFAVNLISKTLIGMGLFVTIDIFLNALFPHFMYRIFKCFDLNEIISFVIVALFMVFVNIHVTF